MSLVNGSPVSAFAMYKQKFSKKQKTSTNGITSIKKKKKSEERPKKASVQLENINKKKKTVKVSNALPSSPKKHTANKNKITKKALDLKQAKKFKTKKSLKNKFDIDKDEPPLLVPIQIPKSKKEKTKKENVVGNSNSCNQSELDNNSLSNIISDLHKTDPSPEGLKLFKWLIASVSPKDFFNLFWEKEILFIERNSPNYYSHLLTTERLDDIFREFPLYYTRNVDVVSYENGVKEVHNEDGRVVASALYDYYNNGCSIRILNPQTYDQKVHLLIATLQEYFGTMVGTNVYLTPPGSQGFAPHFDDIEAFIIQLEGRKHWKLYRPK